MRRRVVITGLGVLSCAGGDLEEFRQHVTRGVCCLSRVEDPRAAHLRSSYAGLLTGTAAARLRVEPGLEGFDRFVHIALVAARDALAAARVQPAALGRRMGLIFATCSGPMLLIEQHYERILRGDAGLNAEELFAKRYHSGASVLAHALGIQGFSTTVVTACSASTAAIALAADLIRSGLLDAALAGGSDAFATSTLAGFEGLKATCESKCAPFSKPFGLNLGEAAGFAFLETPEAAAARGAFVQAELLGAGMSNDAYHCSAPEPSGRGLATAMERALADAGLGPEQITYINAHGTGTEANDKAECKAIRRIFGHRSERVPISSTKSLLGHCLGAAGAMEVAASIVCAEAGVFPPTANFSGPREGCAVDCVPDTGRAWEEPRVFLSNNAAFGGHNASLVLVAAHASDRPTLRSVSHPVGVRSNTAKRLHETIVLTGCGVVSCCGIGAEALVKGMESGQSSIRTVSIPQVPPLRAGMVSDQAVARYDRRLNLRGMDRSSRWATVAARLAMRESGYPETPSALAELGLILSLSAGPSEAESAYLTSFLQHDRRVTELAAFPYLVPNSVAGQVCRALRLTGHNLTMSAGPGAALFGLGPAIGALRTGHAEALLCGAVDELTNRILTDQFMAGQLPRDGTPPPGEGAAVLLIETENHARRRGVKPLASVRGLAFGTKSHTCFPDDAGQPALEELIEDVLFQAKVQRQDIERVCFHGCRNELDRMAAGFFPLWLDRVVTTASQTGWLGGAQPLLDFAVIPATLPEGGHVLVLAASPEGSQAAVLFQIL